MLGAAYTAETNVITGTAVTNNNYGSARYEQSSTLHFGADHRTGSTTLSHCGAKKFAVARPSPPPSRVSQAREASKGDGVLPIDGKCDNQDEGMCASHPS